MGLCILTAESLTTQRVDTVVSQNNVHVKMIWNSYLEKSTAKHSQWILYQLIKYDAIEINSLTTLWKVGLAFTEYDTDCRPTNLIR